MNLTNIIKLDTCRTIPSPAGVWISPMVYLLSFVNLNCHADDTYENIVYE